MVSLRHGTQDSPADCRRLQPLRQLYPPDPQSPASKRAKVESVLSTALRCQVPADRHQYRRRPRPEPPEQER